MYISMLQTQPSSFKGTVHSTFTCPHVTCMPFFLLWNTNKDILKNVGSKQHWTPLTPNTFIKISFWFKTRKVSHTDLEHDDMRVSDWRHNFHLYRLSLSPIWKNALEAWPFHSTHTKQTWTETYSSKKAREGYGFSQGCLRHWAAVALRSGRKSNICNRKSEKSDASLRRKWYFSTSTSYSPHGWRTAIRRRSPVQKRS